MESREALSPVDAAWLRMDSDTNPMVITSLIGLDGPVDHGAFEQLIDRTIAFPRFRQRVAPPPLGIGLAHWEEDPRFDAALHVHRMALPTGGGGGTTGALAELVGDLMSTPLDRSRPLWQLHVVQGVEPPIGHGTALISRVHHCLGDGHTLTRMLLAIAGIEAQPADVGIAPSVSLPGARVADLAERAAKDVVALGKLLFLPFEGRTPLVGKQSRGKCVAWSRPVPLETVKQIARAADAKTNDVLMASVTAAVRALLLRRGALEEGLEVHAIVPILLRATTQDEGLANHFGLAFAALPLTVASPLERLYQMKRRMDAIKASPEADMTFAILGAAGLASARIEKLLVDVFSRKGSLLVTNVPGPPAPIALAGRAVESLTVWAPMAGHVALSVSLLSYAGSVSMTVASDAALVPDPGLMTAAFEDDLAELARIVGQAPGSPE